MADTDALNLLHRALEGEQLSIEDFRRAMKLEEGQHLEFKDGLLTKRSERKNGIAELRKTVNAFANSAGGVLLVGVSDESPRSISPCEVPGSEPLDKWAENLIADMAPMLSPPPRIETIHAAEGRVLLLAVPRAPRLVPCVLAGRTAYFLRLNQSTIEAPEYLLSDLVLGRRQRPSVDLKLDGIGYSIPEGEPYKGFFTFHFEIQNDGLVHVENLSIGVITWTTARKPEHGLNGHLRTYIDTVEPLAAAKIGHTLYPIHLRAEPYPERSRELEPFASRMFRTEACELTLSQAMIFAAVYALPRGTEPLWYQLQYQPPAFSKSELRGRLKSASMEGPVRGRPRLSWEPLTS